jgi:hypothetical protein
MGWMELLKPMAVMLTFNALRGDDNAGQESVQWRY